MTGLTVDLQSLVQAIAAARRKAAEIREGDGPPQGENAPQRAGERRETGSGDVVRFGTAAPDERKAEQ